MEEFEDFFEAIEKASAAEVLLCPADGRYYTEVMQICFSCHCRTGIIHDFGIHGRYCHHCAQKEIPKLLINQLESTLSQRLIIVNQSTYKTLKRILNGEFRSDNPFLD